MWVFRSFSSFDTISHVILFGLHKRCGLGILHVLSGTSQMVLLDGNCFSKQELFKESIRVQFWYQCFFNIYTKQRVESSVIFSGFYKYSNVCI